MEEHEKILKMMKKRRNLGGGKFDVKEEIRGVFFYLLYYEESRFER